MEEKPSIIQFLNFIESRGGIQGLVRLLDLVNSDQLGKAAKSVGMNRSQFSRFVKRNLVKHYSLHPALVTVLKRFVADGNEIVRKVTDDAEEAILIERKLKSLKQRFGLVKFRIFLAMIEDEETWPNNYELGMEWGLKAYSIAMIRNILLIRRALPRELHLLTHEAMIQIPKSKHAA